MASMFFLSPSSVLVVSSIVALNRLIESIIEEVVLVSSPPTSSFFDSSSFSNMVSIFFLSPSTVLVIFSLVDLNRLNGFKLKGGLIGTTSHLVLLTSLSIFFAISCSWSFSSSTSSFKKPVSILFSLSTSTSSAMYSLTLTSFADDVKILSGYKHDGRQVSATSRLLSPSLSVFFAFS